MGISDAGGGEVRVLDDAARASAPGEFVELSDGIVHYEMSGPTDGQVVVLVSGYWIPYFIWDPTVPALAAAGLQVLRYDLYGRGFSDRPDTDYNQDLFDRQLWELVVRLGIRDRVDLVGLSMGGAISVTFADRHPEKVRRLGLIDPSGLPWQQSLVSKLVNMPVIGELLIKLMGDRVVVSRLKEYFYGTKGLEAFERTFKVQMQYAGFIRALLSTNRSGIMQGAAESYRRVGEMGFPVLLLWGREDTVVPFEMNEQVRALLPQAEFHAIDEAAHIPHYQRPETVNPLLVDFLIC